MTDAEQWGIDSQRKADAEVNALRKMLDEKNRDFLGIKDCPCGPHGKAEPGQDQNYEEVCQEQEGDPGLSASDFLDMAKNALERQAAEYDTAGGERSMNRIVRAFNAITERELTEEEGWLFMEILKTVRQHTAKHFRQDTAIDELAYAALKAERGWIDEQISKYVPF